MGEGDPGPVIGSGAPGEEEAEEGGLPAARTNLWARLDTKGHSCGLSTVPHSRQPRMRSLGLTMVGPECNSGLESACTKATSD